ncbi:TSUP family transporter [Chitinophaga sedimenti]|uniref:TSUP family transporter n=1 Tax=Chitinophaga sedimenti TaxID=2033606 RepID=UPI0020046D6C|nr:TSUP family transporter [Chitinophaga sedimenti]MCK7556013.1 TSUP family transporter [Chitinophaga sedimenti]
MHLLGYIASLLIGISLGLIGGGGSILTMPVMVYLFGVSPVTATSYSLFVVGSTSLVGAAQQYKQGTVNIRMALLFAATSVAAVFSPASGWYQPSPSISAAYMGFPLQKAG